jgi:hypothetical protein
MLRLLLLCLFMALAIGQLHEVNVLNLRQEDDTLSTLESMGE